MSVPRRLIRSNRLRAKLLSLAGVVSLVGQASAGSYAALAAQVQQSGGLLQVTAGSDLQGDTQDQLTAVAVGLCHTIAGEGVQVTTVQFVDSNGNIFFTVTGDPLDGC